jgi:hypothetical protein
MENSTSRHLIFKLTPMKRLILPSLVLIQTLTFATAQMPDRIIYNGQQFSLHTNPLEPFFEKHPDKRPHGFGSTALWRGYVATFEIVDEELRLKDIEVRRQVGKEYDKWISVIHEVFEPGMIVKVDWFTGLLVLPYGKRTNYVHMGYGSTYRRYHVLEIDRGSFIRSRRFNGHQYERFKEQQFIAFRQTEEYKTLVESLKQNEDYSEEFIDAFLKSFVISYSTKILVEP